jgi:hypothetical protein
MLCLRRISAAVLLLGLVAAPAMACLAPSAQLTAAEHACCQRMAHQCGAMRNSAHSCCRTEIRASAPFLRARVVTTLPPISPALPILDPARTAAPETGVRLAAFHHLGAKLLRI